MVAENTAEKGGRRRLQRGGGRREKPRPTGIPAFHREPELSPELDKVLEWNVNKLE